MAAVQPDERITWAPQPGPQHALVHCPYREIFYGGTRGGGKSDGLLGRIGYRAGLYGQHYNAVIFRLEMPQSDDLMERAMEVYDGLGRFNRQNSSFRFYSGARVRFRPLRTVADAAKYQGQNLTDAAIEEAGNYPSPDPILRIFACLRSGHGLPTSLVLTGNPGGPGQSWINERYIRHAPNGMTPLVYRFGEHQHVAIYIKSRLQDNQLLMRNDPNYVANLHLVGNDKLVRAWLEGDWSAIEGQFFDEWSEARHVIPNMAIPPHWARFRSIDWGYAAPFSVGWWAIASDDTPLEDGRVIPRGAMVRYLEWYGCQRGQANTGVRLNADEVGRELIKHTLDNEISYTVADPAMWGTDTGPSPAEELQRVGVPLRQADNRRVQSVGHLGGWNQVRQRLKGDEQGRPMLYVMENCVDAIRLLPMMQHDPARPEDIDTASEDHIADEIRYACMSRPYTRPSPQPAKPMQAMPTLNEMLEEQDQCQDM